MENTTNNDQLPNFIIIGAMKAGTTSLHHYLDAHPEISMSIIKEPDFFYEKRGGNWSKSINWYKKQFLNNKLIKGEASPNYTKYPLMGEVAKKMYETIPNAKLIYVLRDPIDRIVSHIHHNLANGREKRSLESIIGDDSRDNIYLMTSKYYYQLSQFLDYYPIESIFITTANRLKNNRLETLHQLFEFLRLKDKTFNSKYFFEEKHKTVKKQKVNPLVKAFNQISFLRSAKRTLKSNLPNDLYQKITRKLHTGKAVPKPQLTAELRQKLVELLREDVQQLRALTGKNFEEWEI